MKKRSKDPNRKTYPRNMKRPNCRQRNLQVLTEVCMKYERKHGLKPGEVPTRAQVEAINEDMVDAIERKVRNVVLTPRDYRDIADEEEANIRKFYERHQRKAN